MKNTKKIIGSSIAFLMLTVLIGNITTPVMADAPNGHTFGLSKGWNMITIPVENDFTAETLGQTIPDCTVICKYDAETQNYQTHVVGVPYNDFPIEDGVGYYVYLITIQKLTIYGDDLTDVELQMYPGDNLVGYFYDESISASSLFDLIPGCQEISILDAWSQTYKTFPGDDFTVDKGMGLFVKVSEPTTWPPILPPPPEPSFTLNLRAGWNMITIPVENDFTAETLGQTIPDCTVICKFNAVTKTYQSHVVGVPHNDFPIEDGVGYYVYVTTSGSVTIYGEDLTDVSVRMHLGWNLVGYFYDEPICIEDLFDMIPWCVKISVLIDGEYRTYDGESNDPGAHYEIEKGMGVFVEIIPCEATPQYWPPQ